MEAGLIGLAGAVVLPVFAREISAFEQELAPIQPQVKMGSIVTKETVLSKWTAWVSADNGIERFSFECSKTKIKVITLAYHKEHRQSSELFKT